MVQRDWEGPDSAGFQLEESGLSAGMGVQWVSMLPGTEESRLSVALGAGTFLPQVLDSDEKSHHQAVTEAMRVIGFSPEEVASVHRILAAILHLVSLAVGSAAISPCGALAGCLPWRSRLASDNQPCNWPTSPSAETELLWLWVPTGRA